MNQEKVIPFSKVQEKIKEKRPSQVILKREDFVKVSRLCMSEAFEEIAIEFPSIDKPDITLFANNLETAEKSIQEVLFSDKDVAIFKENKFMAISSHVVSSITEIASDTLESPYPKQIFALIYTYCKNLYNQFFPYKKSLPIPKKQELKELKEKEKGR